MQKTETKFTGICVGGPKDGQELAHLDSQYDCIEAIAPDPTPFEPAQYGLTIDDKISFTKRGTYYFVDKAISVLGTPINVWVWNGQNHHDILRAVTLKLKAQKKR